LIFPGRTDHRRPGRLPAGDTADCQSALRAAAASDPTRGARSTRKCRASSGESFDMRFCRV